MSAGEPGLESIFFMTRKRRLRNQVAHADVCVMMSGGKRRYEEWVKKLRNSVLNVKERASLNAATKANG